MNTFLNTLKSLRWQAMLLSAAAIWGLATVVLKGAVDEVSPAWLVGIRFTSAGLILSAVFAPRIVKLFKQGVLGDHLKMAALLGVIVGAGYLFNGIGISYTTAAKSAFLTGAYCIMVPFQAWLIMRRKPTAFNVAAALLCLGGIALVSFSSTSALSLGVGDTITLISAVFLGLHVVVTAKVAKGRDMLALTALQFVAAGLLSFAVGVFSAPAPSLGVLLNPDFLGSLAYLVLGGTCAALLLQNIGLTHVAPAPGALLLSFESVFGVVFSVALLGEIITPAMMAGFSLIFASIVVSEWLPTSKLGERMRTLPAITRWKPQSWRFLGMQASYVFAGFIQSTFSPQSMSKRFKASLNVKPPAEVMTTDSALDFGSPLQKWPIVVKYTDASSTGGRP